MNISSEFETKECEACVDLRWNDPYILLTALELSDISFKIETVTTEKIIVTPPSE